MDVTAYNTATNPSTTVTLGAIAQQIWTNGFKHSQKRTVQVSKPINATAPNLFDRLTKLVNFQFAAGQSFDQLGDAVINMGTWPDQVPTLCHISFTQGNQTVWLANAGIDNVELAGKGKDGCLVIWAYTIIGGTWSKTKPF